MGAQQDQSPHRVGSKADGNNATKSQPCRPNFTDRDTELRGAERPAQEMLLSCPGGGGVRTEGRHRPPRYLHSGFLQPVSGLCPSEQGVIIQLPPGASGPLSAEKFSLRLGPLALCHLWAEDTGRAKVTCWARGHVLAKTSPVVAQENIYSKIRSEIW